MNEWIYNIQETIGLFVKHFSLSFFFFYLIILKSNHVILLIHLQWIKSANWNKKNPSGIIIEVYWQLALNLSKGICILSFLGLLDQGCLHFFCLQASSQKTQSKRSSYIKNFNICWVYFIKILFCFNVTLST